MIVEIKGTTWPGLNTKVGPWEGRKFEVPKGYVLVEYVGDPSPFDDPYVTMRIKMGYYSRDQVEIMREMARRAVKPWPHLKRIIRKGQGNGEMKHFQHTYQWGHGNRAKPMAEPGEPGSFFQLMTNHDADLLKSSDSGYQFRIHPNEEQRLILPPTDINIVKKDDARNYRDFTRLIR